MRFIEAYEGWHAGELTQMEAAQLLGMCDRSFRRYLARYDEFDMQGLIDKRIEQVSHRRAPVDEVMKWAATIILAGITTIILAGGEESKAA